MRIPFIPTFAEVDVDDELRGRVAFSKASRGGSAFLFAGALFWTVAGCVAVTAPEAISGRVYLYGGLSVPIVGFLIARLQRATLPAQSVYSPLVMFASSVTVFCLPILIVLERHTPQFVAPALTIIDGAHLPILMWLHLDYTYFLAACAKVAVGMTFLFGLPEYAPTGTGLASGAISLLAGLLALASSRDPLRPYRRRPDN